MVELVFLDDLVEVIGVVVHYDIQILLVFLVRDEVVLHLQDIGVLDLL